MQYPLSLFIFLECFFKSVRVLKLNVFAETFEHPTNNDEGNIAQSELLYYI